MTGSIRGAWPVVLRRLRATWQPLFATHLAYTALGFLVLAPLVGLVGRLLLKLSGRTALADQEIAYFLLTPLGVASLTLVAGLMIAILALESASLMAIGAASAQRRHLGTIGALRFATLRGLRILGFAGRLVVRVLIVVLPFLAVAAAVAWLLLTEHDINYYLAERPPAFWWAAVAIGLVLLAMLLALSHRLLGWALAFPLVVFRGVRPRDAFAQSDRLTAGRRRRLLAVFVVWGLIVLGLGALLIGAIEHVGSWLVPRFSGSLQALVPLLGLLILLWSIGNLFVSAFNGGSFAYLLHELFGRIGPGVPDGLFEDRRLSEDVMGWRATPARLGFLLIGGAAIGVGVGFWLLDGIPTRDSVAVVAHRGAAGKAPENTLAAVRQAIEDGTDWVEIDVQETADGQVVVVHDSDFMKLSGNPLKTWQATFAQLRQIDVGSWFGPAFAGERVPTLAEVLETARGAAGVVIELKYYGHDQALEQRVVDIVEATDMASEVALMSLKYEGIQKVRALRPDWPVGLLSATALGDLAGLDADFLAVNTGLAKLRFIRHAHAQGKQVFVWTVNDPVSMSRMISLGVDGLITDEPEMAREVLADRADLNLVERLMLHVAVLFDRPLPQRTHRDETNR
jgi:glycerophosphoryl diester phosphodiesterase